MVKKTEKEKRGGGWVELITFCCTFLGIIFVLFINSFYFYYELNGGNFIDPVGLYGWNGPLLLFPNYSIASFDELCRDTPEPNDTDACSDC